MRNTDPGIKRKYKIFDYCWHIPHQYDMINALREDCSFYYCLNTKRQWDKRIRPLPADLQFVANYEPGIYDAAILHIDQQVITLYNQKRRIFDEFNELIHDIPKIILNHGTPVFPEGFVDLRFKLTEEQLSQNKLSCVKNLLTEKQMEEKIKEIIYDLVGHNTMVVNSYHSASEEEWGFGTPIIHGMNSTDWRDLPKEPRIFTAIAPYGFDTYYNRSCMVEVADILYNKFGYTLAWAKLNVQTDVSEDAYKDYLGSSLIYLDTSYRTPMNRARTEAFLSGCCVVQVEGAHDLERWAKNGENIILVPNDPHKISEIIADILENRYEEAIRIGANGKKMAMQQFNYRRYREDWLQMLHKVVQQKLAVYEQ